MESISGPVHGYWLATYTVETARGFCGYAKICAEQPAHVWDGTPALAKVTCGPCDAPGQALAKAIEAASARLARRAERLAAARMAG